MTATPTPPQPGQSAPCFDLPTAGGGRINLNHLIGKPVVLYFYPKDDTSACTQEALDFSAALSDFAAAGAVVVGVSRDDVKSHERFAAKHGLSLTLASDVDGRTAEAYGVWVEKSMYGKKYMGVERATFLIDAQGIIRTVWRKVKVPGHVQEALRAAQAL